jgi:hypothetical protein
MRPHRRSEDVPVHAAGTASARQQAAARDGAELLAAIDALDHACLQGGDGEIEAAGARLIALWGLLMNAPSQTPRSSVFLCRDYRPGVAGLDLGDPPERRSRGRTG